MGTNWNAYLLESNYSTRPKQEVAENGYDLSINKYKEIEYIPVEYPSTQEIMVELRELEMQIGEEMDELERLFGI